MYPSQMQKSHWKYASSLLARPLNHSFFAIQLERLQGKVIWDKQCLEYVCDITFGAK